MTSRERVLTAINHKEPDKVPIDLGGTSCTTLTAAANMKLKDYLGITKGGEVIIDELLNCVSPLEEIYCLFDSDCRSIRMKTPKHEPTQIKNEYRNYDDTQNIQNVIENDSIIDEYGTLWVKAEYDYSPCRFPLENTSIDELDSFPWPDPYNPERVEGLRKEAEYLHEHTEYAILADQMCGGPLEQALWLRGYEQLLVDLITDVKFTCALLEKITNLDVRLLEVQLSEIGSLVDIVCMGDDLGTQLDLFISPDMYRKFIKPCHEKLFSFIHSKTDAKLWMHSCGSIYPIIPDLIEIGVDILNPVQCGAHNMGLKKLKDEFGKDLTFWGGGINVQTLQYKSPTEIREEVREAIDIMAPGGGYIFSATHNILPETDGIKTYAAYMTAKEHRNYN